LAFGRVLYDGLLLHRYRDYLNDQFYLGGNGRLRGYLSDEFIGKDLIASNLEFRSRPVQVATLQFAGVLFYDLGDAFNGFESLHIKQSVGAGARLLLPQLDRLVFRVDWGLPLEPPRSSGARARSFDTLPGSVFLTFGQAVPASSILQQQTLY
jgi:hemolysin activation/secretion protein